MAYADQLLANGEHVVRRERQHWVFPFLIAGRWVVVALVVGISGFVVTSFILNAEGDGFISDAIGFLDWLSGWVTLAALAVAAVGFTWSIIQWQTQEYVISNHRVLHVSGVLNKQSTDSSLENITDAQINVSWLGRIIGFGDLKFMTAADAGIEDLRALKDPIGFKKALLEAKTQRLIEINTARPASGPVRSGSAQTSKADRPASAPPPGIAELPYDAAQDVPELLAKLAELRDMGAITEEEFAAKKAELLARI